MRNEIVVVKQKGYESRVKGCRCRANSKGLRGGVFRPGAAEANEAEGTAVRLGLLFLVHEATQYDSDDYKSTYHFLMNAVTDA
jgi:hypothetical protein